MADFAPTLNGNPQSVRCRPHFDFGWCHFRPILHPLQMEILDLCAVRHIPISGGLTFGRFCTHSPVFKGGVVSLSRENAPTLLIPCLSVQGVARKFVASYAAQIVAEHYREVRLDELR